MSTLDRAQLIEQVMQDQQQLLYLSLGSSRLPWAHIDLTMAQLKALITVACSGPLPVGQLGVALGIGKPAASLLVTALVGRGIVVRSEDPVDRRRTLVHISTRGQELVNELLQGRREAASTLLARLDDDDLVALARGTRALVAAAATGSRARSA
ncbi:MAG: MarR family transcriptional regulator [Chloroflexi bacterium]|nr:MarR family transcriptional regulator [Chloroflexota bacterium]